MNGADLLCDSLLANGVDVCFANPGTSEMHFVAALDRKPQMRCVLGLFEGVVTGAADGYARMANKPAATLLHLGPGLANGLANLHNARRARTPIINVVGDHATYHLQHDAPLTSDIHSLAHPMSHWVETVAQAEDMGRAANEAFLAAVSRQAVATLVLPANTAWTEVEGAVIQAAEVPAPEPVDGDAVRRVADAVARGSHVTFVLGGRSLREAPLKIAARLAALTNVQVFAQPSNARIERGAGRYPIRCVPFGIDQGAAALANTELLVLVGAPEPVAFFAYPGKPSRMVRDGCEVVTLADASQDLLAALALVAEATRAPADSASSVTSSAGREVPTSGRLTGEAIASTLASVMPEGAVLVDESITSTPTLFGAVRNAPPFDHLALTGGSIGIGLPLATGAAVACPGRKVITMQADGSGMYTIQALWTQARERLDVVTVVLANRTYNILQNEMRNVGVSDFGENARRMLNIDDPALNWVDMARGMGVPGEQADTIERFRDLLVSAIGRQGPFLIQANL